jgi:hypothetical protein
MEAVELDFRTKFEFGPIILLHGKAIVRLKFEQEKV